MTDKSFSIAKFFPLEAEEADFVAWVNQEIKNRGLACTGRNRIDFTCETQKTNGVPGTNLVTATVTVFTES